MLRMSRKENTIRNIKFGMVNKIIMLILPFIMRTVIINKLGSEYAGLNSLFTSILQVLNLTELGIGSAITFSLYRPLAENDKKLLDTNKDFITTTQREYLKFSEYYRENNDLKEYNSKLSRTNLIAIFTTILISVILIFVLMLVRLLSKRNITDQLTGVYNRTKLNILLQNHLAVIQIGLVMKLITLRLGLILRKKEQAKKIQLKKI